jgi:cytochrome P450
MTSTARTQPTPAALILDETGFTALMARLADRGAGPAPSAAVEAGSGAAPLVVVDRPDVFAAGLALKPQFGRPTPVLRGPAQAFTLVAERPVLLDLGDGSPAGEAQPGQTVSATYPAGVGEAQLMISCDGRSAGIRIGLDPTPPPVADEVWNLPGATAWVLRGTEPATGTAPAVPHSALRCPLVCVEGFPGGHGFAFSHDVLAQHGVLDTLLARGLDLVTVGLDDGTRPLEENAEVVEACLAEVGQRTALPVTLLGWSMGGLLCRIALAGIEARGESHPVTKLVTWDTPHRGAVTQLGVQWLVFEFARLHPALVPAATQLDSPANRQMDLLCLQGDGSLGVDPRRVALMQKLTWPQNCRRVLLSCGRGSGGCDAGGGEVLVHWHAGQLGDIHLRTMGATQPVGEGSWDGHAPDALVADGVAWDGMPGARGSYPADAAGLLLALGEGEVHPIAPPATCQVPTVSALDLDQPPDRAVPERADLIVCATDQPHLAIDQQAAVSVIEQIGAPFDPERFDPHDPAFLSDPYSTYALFRRFAPRSVIDGALWCFRGADCSAVLLDKETWVKQPLQRPQPGPGPTAALAELPPGLFSSDPPAHDALRRAVEAAFREALAQAPQLAAQRAQGILAGLQGTEVIELVQDYALPLPAEILFDLLGLPQDPVLRMVLIGWQQSIATAHDATQTAGARIQGATCSMALRAYFDGLVYGHDSSPVPGLVGSLCDAFSAANLAREQLIATLCDILVAGYLSTTYLIANGMNRLLGEPATLARLRAEPDLVAAAVEELLRLEGPVQLIDRIAARDTTLGNQDVAAGTHVALVVASANHDPDWFDAPEEMRLDRTHGHLAFGGGIHECVGAPLARIVTPIALSALLDHAAQISLDGEPQWQTDPYLRGAISLPLRATPAAVGGEPA